MYEEENGFRTEFSSSKGLGSGAVTIGKEKLCFKKIFEKMCTYGNQGN